LQMERPNDSSAIRVSNPTRSDADIDFVAIDSDGNEVGRATKVVGPQVRVQFTIRTVFPDLSLSGLSAVQIQSSVRPPEDLAIGKGRIRPMLQLSVAFFSQVDPRWSGNQLGTCSGTTIGSAGCAISCIAMAGAHEVSNFNPASLNTYLTNNGGYQGGCLVVWGAAANIDGSGGLTYLGTGSVSSAANLKSQLDSGHYLIATSARFSSHFGIIIGYNGAGTNLSDFYYLDPQDSSAVFRAVGDGWVTASSTTHVYQ
ncbi:MAG: hypothetical protein ACREAC_26070, partial [Blastocatellia bacterium]